jgi:hypothetical protein
MAAINKSPNIFSSTIIHIWRPSVDGHIIARSPYVSIRNDLYAKVCPQYYFIYLPTPTVEIYEAQSEGIF